MVLTPEIPDRTEAPDSIRLGLAAQRLLEDPAFIEAIRATEEEFLTEWYATDADDVAGRERTHGYITALYEVGRQLRIQMDRGEAAKDEQARSEVSPRKD